jgi:hypothetical protein
MTRICVDSFPAAPALMYLVESAFSDCPPETIRSDGRYRAVQPYIGGSIDTIESGKMTGDLALITSLPNPKKLNSEEFILAIKETLDMEA